jgi:cysteine desulfurase
VDLPAPAVYLDHNATTPLLPAAREAMLPFLGPECGNPTSLHGFGVRAARALSRAREQVAGLLGARPSEVVFTASGSESDALAILGALEAAGGRRHVVTSAVEHAAVRDLLRHLRDAGRVELTEIGVAPDGSLDPAAVAAALRDDTALVSVMAANNETGVILPVEALARACRARGIPFHCDAVQAAGKVPLPAGDAAPHLLSAAAHKFHGPRGAGILVVREGARWLPFPSPGRQEGGRRSGTEDVAAAVGAGVAAEEARRAAGDDARLAALRDALEARLVAAVPGASVAGAGAPRLANTSCVLLPGIDAASFVLGADRRGVAVGTGAACGAGKTSHVLHAMGVRGDRARGQVRLSFSRRTTADEAARAGEALEATARAMVAAAGARRRR